MWSKSWDYLKKIWTFFHFFLFWLLLLESRCKNFCFLKEKNYDFHTCSFHWLRVIQNLAIVWKIAMVEQTNKNYIFLVTQASSKKSYFTFLQCLLFFSAKLITHKLWFLCFVEPICVNSKMSTVIWGVYLMIIIIHNQAS